MYRAPKDRSGLGSTGPEFGINYFFSGKNEKCSEWLEMQNKHLMYFLTPEKYTDQFTLRLLVRGGNKYVSVSRTSDQ